MSPTRSETLDASIDAAMGVSRALVAVAARSIAGVEAEVTLPQYRALVLLSGRGVHNVGALAEALGIHASSATRLCDRLIAKGLIERANTPANRREVTVALSAKGRTLVRSVAARRSRELRRIVERLDVASQRALIDAFQTFAEAAGEVPDDAWKLGWTP
jgi:DNA-binding MarR family transcriptional regulator